MVPHLREDGQHGGQRHLPVTGQVIDEQNLFSHGSSFLFQICGFGRPHGSHYKRKSTKYFERAKNLVLFWQGQNDSNTRHAVLEWMWKNH